MKPVELRTLSTVSLNSAAAALRINYASLCIEVYSVFLLYNALDYFRLMYSAVQIICMFDSVPSGLLVLTFDPDTMQRQGVQPGITALSLGGLLLLLLCVRVCVFHVNACVLERERERCVCVCVCVTETVCVHVYGTWCRAVDVLLASQGAAGSMASMLFQVFLCVRQTGLGI